MTEVVAMSAVFPAALFGDGFEHLGGGAPSFLRCLLQIAVRKFPSGLFQEILAC